MSTTAAAAASEVNSAIWHAIAGCSIQIPLLNSYIYYFPQGHLEHSSASGNVGCGNFVNYYNSPLNLCQVISVRFLSDAYSDQAFVKMLLQPVNYRSLRARQINDGEGEINDDVVSYAKVLTPSDANNGGGFSVPRFCADSIFPRLNFGANPPVQTLTMRDTHNNAWEFRHIYRGTPRRHLLTTGWSKFVNGKRLVAGDTVVFTRRNSTNELFIGLRRSVRIGGDNIWDSRSVNCINQSVLKAIESAGRGIAFEVSYYPKIGKPQFVVNAEKVEKALQISWSEGMRVRMAVETDDSWRVTRFQGTIKAATMDSRSLFGSPWRVLQVKWDEPEPLSNMKRVSPWQVEHVLPMKDFHSTNPPSKKLKGLLNPEILPIAEEDFNFPIVESMPKLNYAGFYHFSPNFPPSMQGARQKDHISFTELLNYNRTEPQALTVSTLLNIGSTSNYENLSPAGSQKSVQFSGVRANSIQLFGRTIWMADRIEGHSGSNVDGERNEPFRGMKFLNNESNASSRQPSVFTGLMINCKGPQ